MSSDLHTAILLWIIYILATLVAGLWMIQNYGFPVDAPVFN